MEIYKTPCKICPSCGGRGTIVCDCVPRDVPVDEMVGSVECEECHGDGDYKCKQCSGSGAVCRCTCDEIGESPCPAHHRENELQNQVLTLQSDISHLQQSQDKIWGAADEQLCSDYESQIADIRERLDIAKDALKKIASGHVFETADEAEKWARDIAENAIEEIG